jgi:hypothetical protein
VPEEVASLAGLLEEQMQNTMLTKAQKSLIKQYQDLLYSTAHNAHDRQEFANRMSQLLRYRNIDKLAVRQQLGPLPDLAEAIVKHW